MQPPFLSLFPFHFFPVALFVISFPETPEKLVKIKAKFPKFDNDLITLHDPIFEVYRRNIIRDYVEEKLSQFRERRQQREFGKMKVCASINFLVLIFVVKGKSLNFKDPQKYVNCSQKNRVLWPDYADKRNYFECIGEENFVKRLCPNKTVFNYNVQECTWPEDWKKPPEIDNLVEQELFPSCEKFELHLLWPHEKNPQDYFRCTGVEAFERLTCPADRIFNFVEQKCVTVETTTPSEAADRYPDCLENELHLTWPDPWYPENYFVCTDIGEFELRGCPPGRFFFFMIQLCITEDEIPPIFSTDQKKDVFAENFTILKDTTTKTPKVFPEVTSTNPSGSTVLSSSTAPSTTTSSLISSTTEATQTSPTIFYPKLTCTICWRPTCEKDELHLKWPDYDNERNYFECLSEGVMILKPCAWSFVFDLKQQKCIEVDNRV